MTNIEVPTDTPTEFELGDTAADKQRWRETSEQREREQTQKQKMEEREVVMREETTYSMEEGVAEK